MPSILRQPICLSPRSEEQIILARIQFDVAQEPNKLARLQTTISKDINKPGIDGGHPNEKVFESSNEIVDLTMKPSNVFISILKEEKPDNFSISYFTI